MFNNGKLNIAYVTQEDGGTYTCIAQNPAGTALGKIKLKVLGKLLKYKSSSSE